MLNKEKYMMIFLLIIALCITSMASMHTAAQTIGYTAYVPSQYDGCYTYPAFSTFPGNYPAPSSGSSAHFPTAAPTITPSPRATPTPTQTPTARTATIYGIVTDSNGTAVAGVIVRLQGPSGAQYSTTSGTDGYFEISNVQYDSYTFSYTLGSYTSPTTTLVVNTDSVKRDISLQTQAPAASQAPAAIDRSAIKNWYAAYYTPPTLSNQSVIYDQSGHIVKVVTGNPCQVTETPVSGNNRQ